MPTLIYGSRTIGPLAGHEGLGPVRAGPVIRYETLISTKLGHRPFGTLAEMPGEAVAVLAERKTDKSAANYVQPNPKNP